MVGAVVVQGNRLVAEGWHRAYGQAHAEVDALKRAGRKARGATLYVTLEPCAHWGKTPPCIDAVLRAGIARVVMAMRDPNPLARGGLEKLRKKHVHVTTGILERSSRRLNADFFNRFQRSKPQVLLKVAASLDGRTATLQGESKWITGPPARKASHRLRAQTDAIAVGVETVLKDNPHLTAHGRGANPVRVIFDSRLRAPVKARVFDRQAPSWCLTTDRASLRAIDRFQRKGITVILCRTDSQGRVDVRDALKQLAQRGIGKLLVEGGATLADAFIEARLVDEVAWFVAPLVIGRVRKLKDALRLRRLRREPYGEDLLIRGHVYRNH